MGRVKKYSRQSVQLRRTKALRKNKLNAREEQQNNNSN